MPSLTRCSAMENGRKRECSGGMISDPKPLGKKTNSEVVEAKKQQRCEIKTTGWPSLQVFRFMPFSQLLSELFVFTCAKAFNRFSHSVQMSTSVPGRMVLKSAILSLRE